MKYKKGDKIRIRQWAAMAAQFGLVNENIKTPTIAFTTDMKQFCGCSLEILDVVDWTEDIPYYLTSDHAYAFTNEMIEGYAFEYGELVKVDDDGMSSTKHYLAYVDGTDYPYVVTESLDNRPFVIESWMFAHPIGPKLAALAPLQCPNGHGPMLLIAKKCSSTNAEVNYKADMFFCSVCGLELATSEQLQTALETAKKADSIRLVKKFSV